MPHEKSNKLGSLSLRGKHKVSKWSFSLLAVKVDFFDIKYYSTACVRHLGVTYLIIKDEFKLAVTFLKIYCTKMINNQRFTQTGKCSAYVRQFPFNNAHSNWFTYVHTVDTYTKLL